MRDTTCISFFDDTSKVVHFTKHLDVTIDI